jgi:heme exporter protein D
VAGTLLNGALLALTILAVAVLIAAPLTTLGIMFWHWQKELSRSMRLRQARTTQVR